jgi:hypothetical protein
MAYRIGVPYGYAVRDGAVARDEAVRNAGPTMIVVGCVATGVCVSGTGLEAARAETASPTRRRMEGMNAAATKTASRMKATASMKTASGTKATTTAASAETTAAATVETAAPAATMTRLGYACEREPRHYARHDSSKRQNLLAPSSHIFLHLN